MDAVSQIKQKLDIVDVIAGYISVKKSGKNYKAVCPFHSEDTPSFMISPEIQRYKCFGCGASGDVFNFVQEMEGIEFVDALERLAEKAGVKIEKKEFDTTSKKKNVIFKINELTTNFYMYILTRHKAGKNALDYLKKQRKLTPKTIETFRLGYAPDKWDLLAGFLSKKGFSLEEMLLAGVVAKKRSGDGYIDKFRGRIIFPLIDISNKTVGFTGRDIVGRDPKYLNTEETLVFHKSNYLYSLDKAKVAIKKDGALFVEGQVDVLTAHQNGIENVLASSGTSLTQPQLKIISRYTTDLIFCFDPDSAGISATSRAVALAENFDFDISIAPIPDKFADLDDFIKNAKKEAVASLKNPIPVYDYFLAAAFKLYDKKTAYGKKQIIQYLLPLITKIKNQVTLDHYVKKISDETNIGEEAIRSSIRTGNFSDGKVEVIQTKVNQVISLKKSPEHYLLAILIKGNIDTISPLLYKLEISDFTIPETKELFGLLKNYVDGKPKEFDIQYIVESCTGSLKELILEMYLWDLGGIEVDQKAFAGELQAAVSRIKNNTVKRELKNITEQIKLAELEKNTRYVKELSEKFKNLSEKLT